MKKELWLVIYSLLGFVLPSCLGFIISHCQDPYQPTRLMVCSRGFLPRSLGKRMSPSLLTIHNCMFPDVRQGSDHSVMIKYVTNIYVY